MSAARKTVATAWIDPGLFAQAKVYDNSTGTPALLFSLAMAEQSAGVYVASFLPTVGVSYLVVKRVFTDGTYATADVNYAPSVEDFSAVEADSAGVCAAELTAQIEDGDILQATIDGDEDLFAFLECEAN